MSDNDILYRHLRDDNNVPYATLAARLDKKTLFVGASFVSPNDNPSYKRGREIAGYRLNALIDEQMNSPSQLSAVIEGIADRKQAIQVLHTLGIQENLSNKGLRRFMIIQNQ